MPIHVGRNYLGLISTRCFHTCVFLQGLHQRCQGEYQTDLKRPRNWAKEAVAIGTEWLMVDNIE